MKSLICLPVKAFVLLIGLFLLGIPITIAYSQSRSTSVIDATIRMSVCGNRVAEGSEECDNDDLKGKICRDFGYARGGLTCDIACSIDITGCLEKLPTATPTLLPTQTPIPTVSPTATSQPAAPVSSPTPVPFINLQDLNPLPVLRNISQQELPKILSAFDFDGDKKLEKNELYQAVKLWVDDWRITAADRKNKTLQTGVSSKIQCDINTDKVCDVSDLSILLYYIER